MSTEAAVQLSAFKGVTVGGDITRESLLSAIAALAGNNSILVVKDVVIVPVSAIAYVPIHLDCAGYVDVFPFLRESRTFQQPAMRVRKDHWCSGRRGGAHKWNVARR